MLIFQQTSNQRPITQLKHHGFTWVQTWLQLCCETHSPRADIHISPESPACAHIRHYSLDHRHNSQYPHESLVSLCLWNALEDSLYCVKPLRECRMTIRFIWESVVLYLSFNHWFWRICACLCQVLACTLHICLWCRSELEVTCWLIWSEAIHN